jgi:arylsulfatase A-like enzyme
MLRSNSSRAPARFPVVALLLLTACSARAGESVEAPSAVQSDSASLQHVVVISIDGLRPDAIERYGARTLQQLMQEGRYSLQAQTVLPSKTLPSHTSMLTGVAPEVHGVTWNTDETASRGFVEVPTIFAIASAQDLGTAAFFGKAKLRHLQVPNTLAFTQAPSRSWAMWSASRTVGDLAAYLGRERPALLFIHIGEPDYAGHTMGWMSYVYGRAVRESDKAVARIIRLADQAFGWDNYTVIVTADHGGSGRSHGGESAHDRMIPWIVWGKGVASGPELPGGIRTEDTAATVLWLLGIEIPGHMEGRPVVRAFQERTGHFKAGEPTGASAQSPYFLQAEMERCMRLVGVGAGGLGGVAAARPRVGFSRDQ